MIGIYKITNKLNGKSYIGQSIHCGKRLDEHYTGNQFIDETIQFDGIENFTYEILEVCTKTELSIWEDYYIWKYNTMFPNGYNKKWNCSEKLRSLFIPTQREEINLNKQLVEKDIDIVLCDRDIEILKWANYIQQNHFNKDRICSQQELKEFYKKGQIEANKRIEIPLNEIVLKGDNNLTYDQKKIHKDICKYINEYNQGRVLWSLCYVENPEELKFIDTQEWYFGKYESTQIESLNIGLPHYSKNYLIFTPKEIKIICNYTSCMTLRSWRALFQKEVLNKERFTFLNKQNQVVDINGIKQNKEARNLDMIIIK